jgi:FtsH-binding integral membrane protein
MIGGIIKMLKIIGYILEIWAWIRLALAPTILGCLLGVLIYNDNQTKLRLIIALFLAVSGLIGGIVFATRISRKKGALKFLTRYPSEENEN